MDTTTITTPSGYVVTLKKALSFRHKQALQETLLGDTKVQISAINPNTKDIPVEVPLRQMMAYQRLAMEYLVVQVIDPEKNEAEKPYEAVLDMPEEDGDAVSAAVSEVTNRTKKSPS